MATDKISVQEVCFKAVDSNLSSNSLERDYCHDRYEIVYSRSARGIYKVEGKDFSIFPGSIMIIKAFSYHLVDLENSEGGLVSIKFSEDYLSEQVRRIFNSVVAENSCRYYPPSSVSSDIIYAIDRFELCQSLDPLSAEEFRRALLSEIIILLSRSDSESNSDNDGELGGRVAEYVNRNIERDLSLDKLARRFFVSKYHLCRAFKSYSGISVHSYINHKRIMYAKQLIESGYTASGAAEKVGFGDYSAFYRAYVKIVGNSPTSN